MRSFMILAVLLLTQATLASGASKKQDLFRAPASSYLYSDPSVSGIKDPREHFFNSINYTVATNKDPSTVYVCVPEITRTLSLENGLECKVVKGF